MNLHYLEIFNVVAKFESYKKASDVMHISQPALSVQIRKLEEQIGLKLFDKIGNRIYLSENGKMLQEYTKKIFNIVEELENNIIDKQSFIGGSLNIGGSNTPGIYILPELIGKFKNLYPNIKINLQIGNTAEISQLIGNGTLDFAMNGGNCFYSTYIHCEKIFDDKLILVASPQNPYSDYKNINSEDLRKMRFVIHHTDSQLYTFYKRFLDELNLPENISMCLGSIDAIKSAVIANLGISLIPYVSAKFELKHDILKTLNIDDYSIEYPYSLIYNKNKSLSATSKRFIQFLKDNIKNCDSVE